MTTQVRPLDDLGDESWAVLVTLARALHLRTADPQHTLDAIVTQATETIGPAAHAGLILMLSGRLVPQATIGEPPAVLDSLQQQTGTGPCIDAAREQSVVTIDNTATDARWPEFNARAVELGVASMLCVPLWVDELRLGTLSLYGSEAEAFTTQAVRLAELFAAHAAVALSAAQRAAQLNQALGNRDLIGQAKGILIERMKLTPDDAFARLSIASQATNRKLTVVAEHLVATGELLGPTQR